jgi:hypothetical protein
LNQFRDPLEIFWDAILSREPARIRAAFEPLGIASRAETLAHLRRMATEPDWHPEQRKSAQAALDALAGPPQNPDESRP